MKYKLFLSLLLFSTVCYSQRIDYGFFLGYSLNKQIISYPHSVTKDKLMGVSMRNNPFVGLFISKRVRNRVFSSIETSFANRQLISKDITGNISSESKYTYISLYPSIILSSKGIVLQGGINADILLSNKSVWQKPSPIVYSSRLKIGYQYKKIGINIGYSYPLSEYDKWYFNGRTTGNFKLSSLFVEGRFAIKK